MLNRAIEIVNRVLRTRVQATLEEHEQIMAAFNDIVKALEEKKPSLVHEDDVMMPGKVKD